MNDHTRDDDPQLHAYVDGELDPLHRRRLLEELGRDPARRNLACELRQAKEWIRYSFEGEQAPTQTLPEGRPGPAPWFRPLAASLVLAVLAFGAGWASHSLHGQQESRSAGAASAKPHRVILHIGVAEPARFAATLEKTEALLRQYQGSSFQLEVVANSSGLELVRADVSRHREQIEALIRRYPNVRFIACANGLARLRAMGETPVLITGVHADRSAGDHLIQRLTEGWSYIRI